MNEWGLRGQDTLMALKKSATIYYKFKQQCGFEQMKRLTHSNPTHHSQTLPAIESKT